MTALAARRLLAVLLSTVIAGIMAACATQSSKDPAGVFVTAPQTLASVRRGNEPALSLGATLVFTGEQAAKQFSALQVQELVLVADEEPGSPESQTVGWSTDGKKYLKVFLPADVRCGRDGMSETFEGIPCSFTVLKAVTKAGQTKEFPVGRITVPPHEISSGGK